MMLLYDVGFAILKGFVLPSLLMIGLIVDVVVVSPELFGVGIIVIVFIV